jgi:DNA-binding NarL/FixJ family response regulator
MSIRVLIVDDHGILRAGLRTLIGADPALEVVGEAANGDEAIQQAQALHPEIVLMDIGMPGMDPLDATRYLVENLPGTRVLILSMHEDSVIALEYLRAGASGYAIKRATESELLDAIHAVWRGMIYVHPVLFKALIAPGERSIPKQPTELNVLTCREREILCYLVQGYTNRQIADALCISMRTVETHRANLMEKLNLHSRVDLVRYAAEHKLV